MSALRRWGLRRTHHRRDDRRMARRLESFSDIVIAFALGQIGVSLVIPAHALDFVARPIGIFAFVVTFVVVVRYWWVTDVFFEHFFVASRALVTLNFFALGSLILQVFSLQLFLHFAPIDGGLAASRIYFAFFAISYGALALAIAIGLAKRYATFEPVTRRFGLRLALVSFGIVVGTVVGDARASTDNVQVYVGGTFHSAINRTIDMREETLVAKLPTSIVVYASVGFLLARVASFVANRTVPSLRDEAPAAGVEAVASEPPASAPPVT